jgi:hypothetical protein
MQISPLYHGTNARFAQFDQSKSRIVNDFYGGGVAYFTDNLSVAKNYAKSAAKKSGDPIVYEVTFNPAKIFDVDDIFTGNDLIKFFSKRESEQFARGAGLLNLGADKYTVLDALEEGKLKLTGDQVFRGLSGGMIKTAAAREKLKQLGYEGLRYNGGVNMGMATKHSVYLAYHAYQIRITERMIAGSDQQVSEGLVGNEKYVLV